MILLFGGSFDPVHLGHVETARAAQQALAADTVVWLPTARSPLKDTPGASAADRSEMLRLQLASTAACGWQLSLEELEAPPPSYTIDTLRRWRQRIGPEQPLAFLIGRDSLQTLPAWRDWDRLTEVAHLVVATRPGHEQPLPMALANWWSARQTDQPKLLQCAPSGRILTLTTPPWPISSSILRLALHTREPVADWLAPAVQDYIDHHGLYRPPETPANP